MPGEEAGSREREGDGDV